VSLSFKGLAVANLRRCETTFHPLADWSPTDWATAMGGECGEALNDVKKLRRLAVAPESCAPSERAAYELRKQRVAMELADMVIYADLLAQRLGIDLGESVREKFNKVSEEKGSEVKL
jgi:NTP pyrophosphatase (non-canonical NTP hydrolase)